VHHFVLSPDKAQQFLYLVDGSNKVVRILNRQTLEILANVGGTQATTRASSSTSTAPPWTRRAISISAK
jgi:hypothetical protein